MKRMVACLLLALLAGACETAYERIETNTRDTIEMGGLYTVEPQIEWSRRKGDKGEYWTANGPGLDIIHFVNGLADGDILLDYGRAPDERKEKLPVYRTHMSEIEVMDFIVDTLIATGNGDVEASGLRPAPFGDLPGFRFEIAFAGSNGLDRNAIIAGAIHGELLYLIIYSGARIHYFDAHRGTAEDIIASIEMM